MTAILNSYSFPKPTATTTGLKLFIDPSDGACFSRNKISFGKDIFSFTSPFGVNNGSQSRDTITSPVGSTPLKMTVTGADPHIGSYNGGSPTNTGIAINSGETWTISFYVKGSINTSGEVFIFGADVNGVAFNNGFYDIAAVGYSVTTEWTRKSITYTFTNAASKNLQFRFDGPNAYTTTHNLWFDGLQIERGSTVTNFNSSNSTTLLTDLSGTGSNGTINGGASLSLDGTHLILDGVNDYISGSIPTLSGNAPHTIDSWFNLSSYGAARMWLFVLGQYNTGAHHWILSNETSTQFGSWGQGTQTNPTIQLNQWINIVTTFDGTTFKCYKNGDIVGSVATTFNFTNSQYNIGLRTGAEAFMNGKIATMKLYDRSLSEVEVSQNFNSLRSRFSI
jgi:hypothetical protein